MKAWKRFKNSLSISFMLACAISSGCAGMPENAQHLPAPAPAVQSVCTQANTAVKDYFALIDTAPPEFVKLMTLFPKGGDIHNHLSGSVMPEDYITMGIAAGDCYDPQGYAIVASPCTAANPPLAQANPADRRNLVNSFSMHEFSYPDIQAGHDHFFAAFGKFSVVSWVDKGMMLAMLLRQSYAENVGYVETMTSFQSAAVSSLADRLRQKYPPDGPYYKDSRYYQEMYGYLISLGLDQTAAAAGTDITGYMKRMQDILDCGASNPAPACAVSCRFLSEVNRNADLPKIFTQTALSFRLASTDNRVVGVNLVSGEDLATSMRDFDTQMAIFRYYHERFPQVNIALHAGEITPCLVGAGNPALKEHLTASIAAGAKRIGHGISFEFLNDQDKANVVNLMKKQDILVEIPMTSNAQILGITGDGHPFLQYFRTNHLPTAFSTDDEGVSYTDYTVEWIYAEMEYNLTYDELVDLGRFSLQDSFLPGAPLWQDVRAAKTVAQCDNLPPGATDITEPCRSFLQKSEKATMQWRYEAALTHFNLVYGARFRQYLSAGNWRH